MCTGRYHEIFYDSSDFYQMKTIGGPRWSLSKTNSFYLTTTFSFLCSTVVTPICYTAIYRFKINMHYCQLLKLNSSESFNSKNILGKFQWTFLYSASWHTGHEALSSKKSSLGLDRTNVFPHIFFSCERKQLESQQCVVNAYVSQPELKLTFICNSHLYIYIYIIYFEHNNCTHTDETYLVWLVSNIIS